MHMSYWSVPKSFNLAPLTYLYSAVFMAVWTRKVTSVCQNSHVPVRCQYMVKARAKYSISLRFMHNGRLSDEALCHPSGISPTPVHVVARSRWLMCTSACRPMAIHTSCKCVGKCQAGQWCLCANLGAGGEGVGAAAAGRKTVDFGDLAFAQEGHFMSNKKCDLPKGSHRTAFKVPVTAM